MLRFHGLTLLSTMLCSMFAGGFAGCGDAGKGADTDAGSGMDAGMESDSEVAADAGLEPLQTEVWTGDEIAHCMRDPTVFPHVGWAILSGTGWRVVEYPEILTMVPGQGHGYELKAYTPDGLSRIATANGPWGINFHEWPEGLRLYCSLMTPPDGDFTSTPPTPWAWPRDVYVLKPLASPERTAGGFPMQWRLVRSEPLFSTGSYEGRIYRDPNTDRVFILNDHGKPAPLATVCMWSREMLGPDQASAVEHELLCPGPWDDLNGQWDVTLPYPSEVRFGDGGGIVEGGWVLFHEDTYYLLYSSGAYESPDNYRGALAVCDDLVSPCEKILEGSDEKTLIPGAAREYTMIGRPFPLVVGGQLRNILYHARHDVDLGDDILRCTAEPPLGGSFLADFARGGNGCPVGPAGEYCGNGACDPGETPGTCPADCEDCGQVAAATVQVDRAVFHLGEELSGSVGVDNTSAGVFSAGLTVELYRDGFLVGSHSGGPVVLVADETFELTFAEILGEPLMIPLDNEWLGGHGMEFQVRAGRCMWTAVDTFEIVP